MTLMEEVEIQGRRAGDVFLNEDGNTWTVVLKHGTHNKLKDWWEVFIGNECEILAEVQKGDYKCFWVKDRSSD